MRTILILLFAGCLLGGCVSSKKHKETLSTLGRQHQQQLDTVSQQLNSLTNERDQLRLDLAKTQGGNEALLATQDKLQDRIDRLQDEIENIGNQATNQEKNLNSELADRKAEISSYRSERENLHKLINRWENAQEAVAQEVSIALQAFDSTRYAVDQGNGEVVIVLNENLLFRPGSTSRFRQEGIDALEAISAILAKYPTLYIQIVGHTDNRKVARKSLDNWDYSLLRAGNIAKLLIDDFDLGANRILPAAKSEFAPRTSNETAEGRAANRRMELILSERSTDLAREIKRELER